MSTMDSFASRDREGLVLDGGDEDDGSGEDDDGEDGDDDEKDDEASRCST